MPGEPLALAMAETVHYMIINHTGRLHMSVQDGRPDESEASLFHVLAERVRHGTGGWYLLHVSPPVLDRPAVNEAPDVIGKAAPFFLNTQKGARIGARTVDLAPVAHDSRIPQYLFQSAVVESGNFPGVKPLE